MKLRRPYRPGPLGNKLLGTLEAAGGVYPRAAQLVDDVGTRAAWQLLTTLQREGLVSWHAGGFGVRITRAGRRAIGRRNV